MMGLGLIRGFKVGYGGLSVAWLCPTDQGWILEMEKVKHFVINILHKIDNKVIIWEVLIAFLFMVILLTR